ncbi:MAG TPA: hypothetical protein DDW52_04335 [Planctomycetaceae bacterium]|nr:hypothetical protein [Planctomycetaceae bacterium]
MYRRVFLTAVVFVAFCASSGECLAKPQITLLGTITKWQYPGSKLDRSTMSDGETFNSDGERTVPSSLLQTTMTTSDSADKVVEFYRKLLKPDAKRLPIAEDSDRSVLFRDATGDLPAAMHIVLVNSLESSTTIVVTQAESSGPTRIVWQQYIRHKMPRQNAGVKPR